MPRHALELIFASRQAAAFSSAAHASISRIYLSHHECYYTPFTALRRELSNAFDIIYITHLRIDNAAIYCADGSRAIAFRRPFDDAADALGRSV